MSEGILARDVSLPRLYSSGSLFCFAIDSLAVGGSELYGFLRGLSSLSFIVVLFLYIGDAIVPGL